MFKWYAGSRICFAHLADLADLKAPAAWLLSNTDLASKLGGCRWFTRGWTLQELIAPLLVKFYDSHWNWAFDKGDKVDALSSLTGIDRSVLRSSMTSRSLSGFALARKMSWAASRQTTRIEDTAYCLMGIFDINMPLLYGEGEKAFQRLQEEIIKRNNDPSVYTWGSGASNQRLQGVLAASPRDFQTIGGLAAGAVFSSASGRHKLLLEESAITNKGIRLKADLLRHGSGGYFMPLDCSYIFSNEIPVDSNVVMDDNSHGTLRNGGLRDLFLHLTMIGPSTFARKGLVWSVPLQFSDQRVVVKSVYMTPYFDYSLHLLVTRSYTDAFLLQHNSGTRWSYRFGDISPSDWLDDSRSLMFTFGSNAFVGHASCRISAAMDGGIPQVFNIWVRFGIASLSTWVTSGERYWIDIGIDREFHTDQDQQRSVTRPFQCGEDVFKVTAAVNGGELDGYVVNAITISIE